MAYADTIGIESKTKRGDKPWAGQYKSACLHVFLANSRHLRDLSAGHLLPLPVLFQTSFLSFKDFCLQIPPRPNLKNEHREKKLQETFLLYFVIIFSS